MGPELAALVETMLHESSLGVLKSASDHLHASLARLTGLPDDSRQPDDLAELRLAGGKAIAPRDAARCVRDLGRTAMFMRGVLAAVAEAARRFPPPIEVLYAGCGPFAVLTLPLIAASGPDQVQLTLVDVHERSLRAARLLYEHIGALAHVRAFICADAAAYAADTARPPHVVVTETMQQALMREPQVAVTRHLVPQLAPGGLLVPERVTVDAYLIDLSKEFAFAGATLQRDRIRLGTLLTLSAAMNDPCQPVVVEIPSVDARFSLHLLTRIQVFADLVLDDYDASLTLPVPIALPAGARRIEFRYRLDGDPRWEHRSL